MKSDLPGTDFYVKKQLKLRGFSTTCMIKHGPFKVVSNLCSIFSRFGAFCSAIKGRSTEIKYNINRIRDL